MSKRGWHLTYLIVFLYALLWGCAADAATNLPVACSNTAADGQTTSACPWAAQTFELAGENTLVRSCATSSCTFSTTVWRRYGALASSAYVEVCLHDRPAGSPVSGGWCDSDDHGWTNMRFVPKAQVATVAVEPEPEQEPEPEPDAIEGVFSVVPVTGTAPLKAQLSWNVTGAESCVASGAWSGEKPSTGTESFALDEDATFTLTCESGGTEEIPGVPGDNTAKLTWVAPTQNTDGTPITNLAGFRIAYGQGDALTQTIEINDAARREHTVNMLAPGLWSFAITAFNSAGAESVQSARVTKEMRAAVPPVPAVPGVTWSRSVSVSVEPAPIPEPPTELRVVDAEVYEINDASAVAVGVAALGAKCDRARQREVLGTTYYGVERVAVDFISMPMNKTFVDLYARCG